MRLFSLIPALAALVTVVAGVSLPRDVCHDSEIKCGLNHDTKRDFTAHPSRDFHALTNAELLRRGLPLKEPVMRRGSPVRRHRPSSVPDPKPDPKPKINHSGIIEVRNAANGDLLGYISKNLVNGGAQFGYDPSVVNAVVVSFKTDHTGSGTQLDISIASSNPDWPLLGLVQGRDDTNSNIQAGSYQYLYIGGIAKPGTKPGDKPTLIDNSYFIGAPRTAESAVWTFEGSSGNLTPHWINEDGNPPNQQEHWTQSTGLYSGGDRAAFVARYPAPAIPITYHFVPQ